MVAHPMALANGLIEEAAGGPAHGRARELSLASFVAHVLAGFLTSVATGLRSSGSIKTYARKLCHINYMPKGRKAVPLKAMCYCAHPLLFQGYWLGGVPLRKDPVLRCRPPSPYLWSALLPKTACEKAQRRFWVVPTTREDIKVGEKHGLKDYLFQSEEEVEYNGEFGAYCIDHGDRNLANGIGVVKKWIMSAMTGVSIWKNVGICGSVSNEEELEALVRRAKEFELEPIDGHVGCLVIVNLVGGWRVIPAENLVALSTEKGKESFGEGPLEILVKVESTEDAKVMLGALERGVGGVVLQGGNHEELIKLGALKREYLESEAPRVELVEGSVKGLTKVGMGDRVCVDTCSILGEDEGMLVGSAAGALGLVLSESVEVGYVPTRAFRVNAGPVSSYVMCKDGQTRYLGELQAGDEVLVVSRGGKKRTAIVGRVKIETRPLIVIEIEVEDRIGKILLQDAETVRVATGAEEWVSVSEMKPGGRVLMSLEIAARHMGLPITEMIVEK